jgi:hypothetical protein
MSTSTTFYLTEEDQKIAQKVSAVQLTQKRRKLFYLAILARCAGKRLFDYLDIEIDLKQSNNCNVNNMLFGDFDDLALPDLYLPEIGRVIFPPICPGDDGFSIFSEIAEDVIGYIPIKLKPIESSEGNIAISNIVQVEGFISRDTVIELVNDNDSTKIPIDKLQELDEFLDTINPIISDEEDESDEEKPPVPKDKILILDGWRWKTQKREGWVTPEEFINRKVSPQPNTSEAKSDEEFKAASGGEFKAASGGEFKAASDRTLIVTSGGYIAASGFTLPKPNAQRVKLIELEGQQLKLSVGLITKSGRLEDEVDISVIIESVDAETNLPKDLILELLSQDGEVKTYDRTDKETQKLIHIEMTDELSFDYTIKVSLGDDEFTENIVMEKISKINSPANTQ